MSKIGLPTSVQMRHDFHYVEELSRANRPVGKMIPIDRIYPNSEQPRVDFGDLSELTESIREKGVLEPLLVKPTADGKYMIIAGERRWRASNLAGLEELPCIELDIDDKNVAEIALIENLQRKDLTIWEEADGLKALADKFGYTQEAIAKKISKSRTTVTELMTIANLPASVRSKCQAAQISSKATLLEIARQFDEAAMESFTDKLVSGAVKKSEIKTAARADRTASSARTGKTFRYAAGSGEFIVRLDFPSVDALDKQAVLTALKDTHDALSSGQIDV